VNLRQSKNFGLCRTSLTMTRLASPPEFRTASHGLIPPLTNSEAQVPQLLATPVTGHEIDLELLMSPNAVESHARRLFVKLGLRSRGHGRWAEQPCSISSSCPQGGGRRKHVPGVRADSVETVNDGSRGRNVVRRDEMVGDNTRPNSVFN
jgi:DNA-binding CsgD family transcriptional regulator